MTFYLLLSLAAAAASLSYLFRVSAYMENAREWWWKRAPRATFVLEQGEEPGRFWPFPVSRSWLYCVANTAPRLHAPDTKRLPPMFHDGDLMNKPIIAVDDGDPSQARVWYSKDGVMLGRVLTCRMCFTFWCAVVVCLPTLWPYPGGWTLRLISVSVVQVFAVWWAGVVANAVFEHPLVVDQQTEPAS